MKPVSMSQYAASQYTTAHLVRPKPFQSFLNEPPQTVSAGFNAIFRQQGADADLARLDWNTKVAGSAFIAGLATLSATAGRTALGEFLGFASFFTAMDAVPKFINGLVHWTKGVNLNQRYQDSQGVKRSLFLDRQFMPLNLLPDEEIEHIADRLKIPPGPAQRRLTEEKIGQIAVQARTWWMLTAAPGTVALSGLMCHFFEKPIANLFNRLSAQYHLLRAKGQPLGDHLDRHLAKAIGGTQHSQLSTWWQTFGRGVVRNSGMNWGLANQPLLNGGEEVGRAVLAHLATLSRPGNEKALERTLNYLESQKKQLLEMKEDLTATVRAHERHIAEGVGSLERQLGSVALKDAGSAPAQMVNERLAMIDDAFKGPLATLNNHRSLFEEIRKLSNKGLSEADVARRISPLAKETVIGSVLEAWTRGEHELAQALSGGCEKTMRKVLSQLKSNQTLEAFRDAGASPMFTFTHNLKEMRQATRFRAWSFGVLGLLALGTALYNEFVIGKQYKPEGNP